MAEGERRGPTALICEGQLTVVARGRSPAAPNALRQGLVANNKNKMLDDLLSRLQAGAEITPIRAVQRAWRIASNISWTKHHISDPEDCRVS